MLRPQSSCISSTSCPSLGPVKHRTGTVGVGRAPLQPDTADGVVAGEESENFPRGVLRGSLASIFVAFILTHWIVQVGQVGHFVCWEGNFYTPSPVRLTELPALKKEARMCTRECPPPQWDIWRSEARGPRGCQSGGVKVCRLEAFWPSPAWGCGVEARFISRTLHSAFACQLCRLFFPWFLLPTFSVLSHPPGRALGTKAFC